jgi:hypothetical protein
MTSAARLMRLSEKPCATAASVFIEHGAITMPAVMNEPLAIEAPTSRTLCTTSASFVMSLRASWYSCHALSMPASETTRCVSQPPIPRSFSSMRRP